MDSVLASCGNEMEKDSRQKFVVSLGSSVSIANGL